MYWHMNYVMFNSARFQKIKKSTLLRLVLKKKKKSTALMTYFFNDLIKYKEYISNN